MSRQHPEKWRAAFLSNKQDWATPSPLVIATCHRYLVEPFAWDACAYEHTSVGKVGYYSEEDNALEQPWAPPGTPRDWAVWCNPPYKGIQSWVKKAYEESLTLAPEQSIWLLTFARTDTRWWHKYVKHARRVIFLKGRVKFVGGKASAPAPSVLVEFASPQISPETRMTWPIMELWDWQAKPVDRSASSPDPYQHLLDRQRLLDAMVEERDEREATAKTEEEAP